MTSDHLIIFDTTLRDGEQSPGAAMTKEEKIRVARQLERLGVDVIEAGFAAASPGDFEAISNIAAAIKVPLFAHLPVPMKKIFAVLEKPLKRRIVAVCIRLLRPVRFICNTSCA